jgi:hypothetical protein
MVVIHPRFVPSNNPVKHFFSFNCITLRETHSIHFSWSISSLGTHCVHTLWNFKRSCIMLYAKPWEHPSAVATLSIIILLSAQIDSSTCLYRCFCRILNGETWDLVGHYLWLMKVLERISWPSCELLYTTNTPHCKHETFLYEYPLYRVLLPPPQKNASATYTVMKLDCAAI